MSALSAGHEEGQIARVLLGKYREMLRLRRGDLDGSIADPRPAMAALAGAFPGALREIDRIPMAELERRCAHLEGASLGLPAEPWVGVIFDYHRMLRGALLVRRWWVERASEGGVLAEDLAGEADALAWADALGQVQRPPGGRLVELVLQRLAARRGVTTTALREMLFAFEPREGGDDVLGDGGSR